MPSDRTDLAVVLLSIFAYALVFAMFASWFMVFGPWTKWVRFPLMLIAMFGVAYWLAHRAILHIESPNA